ncbi:MAG: GntR family transcriptional regulator [Clostridia bacterium]|nr:GntR family transcriptional regulator [Clostridia bacterium]
MEKKAWLELLMDFYGQMLTERQRAAVSLYCGEDLSLAEIAEQEGISRQGVRDALQRAEKTLTQMEEQLQLATRYQKLKMGLLELSENLLQNGNAESAQRIRSLLNDWEG